MGCDLFDNDGKEVHHLKELILKMDRKHMIEEANNNYMHSKDYNPDVLEVRRNTVFVNTVEET